MPVIQVTEIQLGGITENANANDRTTQVDMGGVAINGNTVAKITQIVFLAIRRAGGFRELITPMTSHDEDE